MQVMHHFHGDLVMRDDEKLHLCRHVAHEITETARVLVIQRRVHLIQQAGGPSPALIDYGVQQVRKRRGTGQGKVILLPS